MEFRFGRFGEVVLVGALTFLCSLPLLTITSAVAAAYRTLDDHPTGTPGLTVGYLEAFRARWRRGLIVQLVWAIPALLGAFDLWFGLSAPTGSPVGAVFTGLGGALVIFALILRPFLAARMAVDGDRRLPVTVRTAMLLAGAQPGRTLLVLAIDVAVITIGIAAFAAVPFVLGPAIALQARMIRASTDGIARRTAVRWR